MNNDLGNKIKHWRKRNYISQQHLAYLINVSQQAISRWESGKDIPSAQCLARLTELMRNNEELLIEKSFIADQSTIRALIDTDGGRLLGYSKGFEFIWPSLAKLEGEFLEDKIINELQSLIATPELKKQMLGREIVVISGVSFRHLDLDIDLSLKHSWHICIRKLGIKTVADMIFEPSNEETSLGVKKILRLGDMKI